MDNILDKLKARLRYNKKRSFLLTGEDVKELVEYFENLSNSVEQNVKTFKFTLSASEINDLGQRILLTAPVGKKFEILNVSAKFEGQPMDNPSGLAIYLGEEGTPSAIFNLGDILQSPDNYISVPPNNTPTNVYDARLLSISGQSVTGGDSSTLLTILITYLEYAD